MEAKDFSSPQKTDNSPSLSPYRAPLSEHVTTKCKMEREQSPLLTRACYSKDTSQNGQEKNFPELSPKTTILFSPKWKPHQLKQLLRVSLFMILRNNLESYVGNLHFAKIISSSNPAADQRCQYCFVPEKSELLSDQSVANSAVFHHQPEQSSHKFHICMPAWLHKLV